MRRFFAVEVSVPSDDAAPAQAVLDGPQERADAATNDIRGAGYDGKGRHLLEHNIFQI